MKKQYETPKLVVLGDIKEITKLGSLERVLGSFEFRLYRNCRGDSLCGGGSG